MLLNVEIGVGELNLQNELLDKAAEEVRSALQECEPLDLVCVHVGKTAGNSMFRVLESHYGIDAICRDNTLTHLLDSVKRERVGREVAETLSTGNIRCVFGHFWAGRYQSTPAKVRATFLRDPITKLISHYWYWKEKPLLPDDDELKRRFLYEKWSLVELAVQINSRISSLYFDGVDMQQFNIIGRFENLESDFADLMRLVGGNGSLRHENRSPADEYAQKVEATMKDKALVNELRVVLADEYKFYDRWAGSGTSG